MINYCTRVGIPPSSFGICYRDRTLFAGSCFAGYIGNEMVRHGFQAEVNPFGVVYNPLSVAIGCSRLLQPIPFDAGDLFYDQGLYHSFMHHGKFSETSAADALSKMNEALATAAGFIKELSCFVVTWGTAFVYRLKEDGRVVANCHKLPAARFERKRLTTDTIVAEWAALLEAMWKVNPSMQVIFTVSPIRHWKEGAHENQLSKATLLLAEQTLAEMYPGHITYFPAYELMMDELRDYRFYADDLLHPSNVAVQYIWERFCDTYMDAATKELMEEMKAIDKAHHHRPFNPSSDAHKQFLNQTLLKIRWLQDKYPYLCLSGAEKEITNRLQAIE